MEEINTPRLASINQEVQWTIRSMRENCSIDLEYCGVNIIDAIRNEITRTISRSFRRTYYAIRSDLERKYLCELECDSHKTSMIKALQHRVFTALSKKKIRHKKNKIIYIHRSARLASIINALEGLDGVSIASSKKIVSTRALWTPTIAENQASILNSVAPILQIIRGELKRHNWPLDDRDIS